MIEIFLEVTTNLLKCAEKNFEQNSLDRSFQVFVGEACVSGIVFLFILNKQNSVIILIVISIWLICNFLLFWLVFKMINNDFSNKFKAFGAFNATNAIQTQNVTMAKELFFLGEPHDIVINNVENPMTLGLFYINEVSPNLKLVEEGLNIRILANINEVDSM